MRRRLEPILVSQLGKAEIERIVAVLNSKKASPLRDQLRSLVEKWLASGPNLQVMLCREDLLEWRLRESWKAQYRPQASGRAQLELVPGRPLSSTEMYRYYQGRPFKEGKAAFEAERDALLLFAALTLNPYCWQLGRCARAVEKCGRYFVKERTGKTEKRYCSPKCHRFGTGEGKYAAGRQKKLSKAQNAIDRYYKLKRRPALGWKEWVSQKTGITLNFLTHAVSKLPPDLRLPTEKA
jgi:hypothetical protein